MRFKAGCFPLLLLLLITVMRPLKSQCVASWTTGGVNRYHSIRISPLQMRFLTWIIRKFKLDELMEKSRQRNQPWYVCDYKDQDSQRCAQQLSVPIPFRHTGAVLRETTDVRGVDRRRRFRQRWWCFACDATRRQWFTVKYWRRNGLPLAVFHVVQLVGICRVNREQVCRMTHWLGIPFNVLTLQCWRF